VGRQLRRALFQVQKGKKSSNQRIRMKNGHNRRGKEALWEVGTGSRGGEKRGGKGPGEKRVPWDIVDGSKAVF